MVAAVDPGRSKCGLVLADCSRGEIKDALVVLADDTLTQLERWHQHTPLTALVLGDGTSSKAWQQQLQHLAPMRIVKKAGTTLRARERYWQIWPARGWRRLLPQGLRLPQRAGRHRSACLAGRPAPSALDLAPSSNKEQDSEPCPHGKGVIPARFQMIVGLHQKPQQGVLD